MTVEQATELALGTEPRRRTSGGRGQVAAGEHDQRVDHGHRSRATVRMTKSNGSPLPVTISPGWKWWKSEYSCDQATSRQNEPRISRK